VTDPFPAGMSVDPRRDSPIRAAVPFARILRATRSSRSTGGTVAVNSSCTITVNVTTIVVGETVNTTGR